MANTFRIVNLGDSVPWGQGLLEDEKYDVMIRNALLPSFPGGVTLERFAHSGAVIGAGPVTGGAANGEVPISRPTIIEQCDSFHNSRETVDLVLVNGGINDIGVATILNPAAIVPPLESRIVAACHDAMLVLLRKVSAKFSKPSCRIFVTGYYLILSDLSDPFQVPKMLMLHGVAVPGLALPGFNVPHLVSAADFFDVVFDRCERFAAGSATELQRAIADVHDPRITFVPSGFTAANAVFVPGTSLLWGLDDLLNPEDPVAAARHTQCEITFGNALQILHREQCFRASAGHPNVTGAIQYRQQILAALG